MARLSRDELLMALVGYEARRAEIEANIREIRQRLGMRSRGRPPRIPMTPDGKKVISRAQKARWRKIRENWPAEHRKRALRVWTKAE